ncbi:MAG TPA: cell division protein FtsQ/DivIB [Thiolinea sp.]|nr:cell division protein FtsQ/DivIB [Thiolinea sp.]
MRRKVVRGEPRRLDLSQATWNRMSYVAALMVVAGALLWVTAWINKPESLTINQIDWQGRFEYVSRAELEALAAPWVDTNLYLLDAARLETTLEGHPWVRDVSMYKAWPRQLIVRVEEQHPVAFWGDDQLLNQYGEVFPGTLVEKQGIFPTIYSPKASGREMGERYVRVMNVLKGLGLEVVELTEDDRGSWRMRFRQGPDVIIGRKEQDRRIERFKVGFMQELKSRFADIRRIDLRYTNGFAVEWVKGKKVGYLDGSLMRLPQSLRS